MDYFTEYFEEAGPENEAQVIEELGDPKDAAEEIIRSLSSNQAEETSTRPQHQSSAHNRNHIPTMLISLKTMQQSLNCILMSPRKIF